VVAGRAYVPDRGDLVWITLSPQAGHEQAGRRPALVISPFAYNQRVGLAVICPVTSHAKGYPFEVRLPSDGTVQGVVLADQLKSVDWKARRAEFAGHVTPEVLGEALTKLATLVQ
jgi:mRNA interferase MazF